jgi:hypothetical protein
MFIGSLIYSGFKLFFLKMESLNVANESKLHIVNLAWKELIFNGHDGYLLHVMTHRIGAFNWKLHYIYFKSMQVVQ